MDNFKLDSTVSSPRDFGTFKPRILKYRGQLYESIMQTSTLCRDMGSDDESDLTEAVVTCEGNLHDPDFSTKFQLIVDKLKSLLYKNKREENFKVRKIEPWNSVRVTISIPKEAAQKLRALAQQGNHVLRQLGILSVQVEGDQVISLTLSGKNNEPQELILSQSSGSSSNDGSSLPSASSFLSSLVPNSHGPSQRSNLPSSSNPSQFNFELSGSTLQSGPTFLSPNVVAPSGKSIPSLPKTGSITPNRPVPGGPFPFASMTHAVHTLQRNDSLTLSPGKSSVPSSPSYSPSPSPGPSKNNSVKSTNGAQSVLQNQPQAVLLTARSDQTRFIYNSNSWSAVGVNPNTDVNVNNNSGQSQTAQLSPSPSSTPVSQSLQIQFVKGPQNSQTPPPYSIQNQSFQIRLPQSQFQQANNYSSTVSTTNVLLTSDKPNASPLLVNLLQHGENGSNSPSTPTLGLQTQTNLKDQNQVIDEARTSMPPPPLSISLSADNPKVKRYQLLQQQRKIKRGLSLDTQGSLMSPMSPAPRQSPTLHSEPGSPMGLPDSAVHNNSESLTTVQSSNVSGAVQTPQNISQGQVRQMATIYQQQGGNFRIVNQVSMAALQQQYQGQVTRATLLGSGIRFTTNQIQQSQNIQQIIQQQRQQIQNGPTSYPQQQQQQQRFQFFQAQDNTGQSYSVQIQRPQTLQLQVQGNPQQQQNVQILQQGVTQQQQIVQQGIPLQQNSQIQQGVSLQNECQNVQLQQQNVQIQLQGHPQPQQFQALQIQQQLHPQQAQGIQGQSQQVGGMRIQQQVHPQQVQGLTQQQQQFLYQQRQTMFQSNQQHIPTTQNQPQHQNISSQNMQHNISQNQQIQNSGPVESQNQHQQNLISQNQNQQVTSQPMQQQPGIITQSQHQSMNFHQNQQQVIAQKQQQFQLQQRQMLLSQQNQQYLQNQSNHNQKMEESHQQIQIVMQNQQSVQQIQPIFQTQQNIPQSQNKVLQNSQFLDNRGQPVQTVNQNQALQEMGEDQMNSNMVQQNETMQNQSQVNSQNLIQQRQIQQNFHQQELTSNSSLVNTLNVNHVIAQTQSQGGYRTFVPLTSTSLLNTIPQSMTENQMTSIGETCISKTNTQSTPTTVTFITPSAPPPRLISTMHRAILNSQIQSDVKSPTSQGKMIRQTSKPHLTGGKPRLLLNPLTGHLEPIPGESGEFSSSGSEDDEEEGHKGKGKGMRGKHIKRLTKSIDQPVVVSGGKPLSVLTALEKPGALRVSSILTPPHSSAGLIPLESSPSGEKIKLRLKLEKHEPPSPYKLDVSYVKKPEKITASFEGGIETSTNTSASEPRVPPLHISIRGKNSAVVVSPRRDEPSGSNIGITYNPNIPPPPLTPKSQSVFPVISTNNMDFGLMPVLTPQQIQNKTDSPLPPNSKPVKARKNAKGSRPKAPKELDLPSSYTPGKIRLKSKSTSSFSLDSENPEDITPKPRKKNSRRRSEVLNSKETFGLIPMSRSDISAHVRQFLPEIQPPSLIDSKTTPDPQSKSSDVSQVPTTVIAKGEISQSEGSETNLDDSKRVIIPMHLKSDVFRENDNSITGNISSNPKVLEHQHELVTKTKNSVSEPEVVIDVKQKAIRPIPDLVALTPKSTQHISTSDVSLHLESTPIIPYSDNSLKVDLVSNITTPDVSLPISDTKSPNNSSDLEPTENMPALTAILPTNPEKHTTEVKVENPSDIAVKETGDRLENVVDKEIVESFSDSMSALVLPIIPSLKEDQTPLANNGATSEDSGIDSMDALSEKSPNQGESPLRKETENVFISTSEQPALQTEKESISNHLMEIDSHDELPTCNLPTDTPLPPDFLKVNENKPMLKVDIIPAEETSTSEEISNVAKEDSSVRLETEVDAEIIEVSSKEPVKETKNCMAEGIVFEQLDAQLEQIEAGEKQNTPMAIEHPQSDIDLMADSEDNSSEQKVNSCIEKSDVDSTLCQIEQPLYEKIQESEIIKGEKSNEEISEHPMEPDVVSTLQRDVVMELPIIQSFTLTDEKLEPPVEEIPEKTDLVLAKEKVIEQEDRPVGLDANITVDIPSQTKSNETPICNEMDSHTEKHEKHLAVIEEEFKDSKSEDQGRGEEMTEFHLDGTTITPTLEHLGEPITPSNNEVVKESASETIQEKPATTKHHDLELKEEIPLLQHQKGSIEEGKSEAVEDTLKEMEEKISPKQMDENVLPTENSDSGSVVPEEKSTPVIQNQEAVAMEISSEIVEKSVQPPERPITVALPDVEILHTTVASPSSVVAPVMATPSPVVSVAKSSHVLGLTTVTSNITSIMKPELSAIPKSEISKVTKPIGSVNPIVKSTPAPIQEQSHSQDETLTASISLAQTSACEAQQLPTGAKTSNSAISEVATLTETVVSCKVEESIALVTKNTAAAAILKSTIPVSQVPDSDSIQSLPSKQRAIPVSVLPRFDTPQTPQKQSPRFFVRDGVLSPLPNLVRPTQPGAPAQAINRPIPIPPLEFKPVQAGPAVTTVGRGRLEAIISALGVKTNQDTIHRHPAPMQSLMDAHGNVIRIPGVGNVIQVSSASFSGSAPTKHPNIISIPGTGTAGNPTRIAIPANLTHHLNSQVHSPTAITVLPSGQKVVPIKLLTIPKGTGSPHNQTLQPNRSSPTIIDVSNRSGSPQFITAQRVGSPRPLQTTPLNLSQVGAGNITLVPLSGSHPHIQKVLVSSPVKGQNVIQMMVNANSVSQSQPTQTQPTTIRVVRPGGGFVDFKREPTTGALTMSQSSLEQLQSEGALKQVPVTFPVSQQAYVGLPEPSLKPTTIQSVGVDQSISNANPVPAEELEDELEDEEDFGFEGDIIHDEQDVASALASAELQNCVTENGLEPMHNEESQTKLVNNFTSLAQSPTHPASGDIHGEDQEIIDSFSKNYNLEPEEEAAATDHTYVAGSRNRKRKEDSHEKEKTLRELSIEIPPPDMQLQPEQGSSESGNEKSNVCRSTRSNTRIVSVSPDITALTTSRSDTPKLLPPTTKFSTRELRNSPKPSPTGSVKLQSPASSFSPGSLNSRDSSSPIPTSNQIQSKTSGKVNKRKRRGSDSSSASREENGEDKVELIDLNARPGKRRCSENAAELIKACIGAEDTPKRNTLLIKRLEEAKAKESKLKKSILAVVDESEEDFESVDLGLRGRGERSSRGSSEDRSSSRGSSINRHPLPTKAQQKDEDKETKTNARTTASNRNAVSSRKKKETTKDEVIETTYNKATKSKPVVGKQKQTNSTPKGRGTCQKKEINIGEKPNQSKSGSRGTENSRRKTRSSGGGIPDIESSAAKRRRISKDSKP